MNNDYEDIINMTDEEAAKILENTRLMIMSGRRSSKVTLDLSVCVALKKAIQALKLNAYLPNMISTAAGAGYETGKEEREKAHHYLLGLKKIAYYYGITPQLGILQEECAELIQAISKHLRGEPKDNMLEEIADVEIMIDQIKSLLCGNDLQAINHIKENKIDRQLARIEAREREEAINNEKAET